MSPHHHSWLTGNGVLPSQWIRAALEVEIVQAGQPVLSGQIQPNSLDLRIGAHAYRIRCSFLPGDAGIEEKLRRFKWYDVPIGDGGAVLERNQVYLFPLQERINLPPEVYARSNPKSTTGRLDLFTRVVTETGNSFDEVPAGYRGKLYLEVVPRSFPVRVRCGDCLTQIRFQVGDPVMSDAEVIAKLKEDLIVLSRQSESLDEQSLKIANGVFLSVALSSDAGNVVGYRAKKNTPPVDFGAHGSLEVGTYWQEIILPATRPLILEPDEFYILASRELIRLPPTMCAEMIPFVASSGELRTHYAGFFDSGFGYARGLPAQASAAAAVLEVRSRDVPFLLEDCHPLFRLVFLRTVNAPDMLYGQSISSNYQAQRLRLARQFKRQS